MKLSFAVILTLVLAAAGGVALQKFAPETLRPSFLIEQSGMAGRPPAEIISEAASELVTLAEAQCGESESDRAAELVDAASAAFTAIKEDKNGDDDEINQARYSTVIAHYAATTIDRSRFGEPFAQLVQQVNLEIPNSPVALQATMLQVLARHDLSRPAGRKFVTDIEKFAADRTPNQGAALYCLAAQELVRNEQPDAAKALMRRGIKAYRAAPGTAAILVNQLADLGLSKAAPTKFSQAQYNAMIQGIEKYGNGARGRSAGGALGKPANSCGPRRT